MRTIKYTSRFKRDYRRQKSGTLGKKLDGLLMDVVNLLAANMPLPYHNFDHALIGEWRDHRDCHIRPDLVLIYRLPDDDAIESLCASALTASLAYDLRLCASLDRQPKPVRTGDSLAGGRC